MDPTLKARIMGQLTREMPTYTKGLARVAKFILDRPAEFGVNTIRESAAKIGVSTNTLVRMAERLGFENFESLRAPFRQALTTNLEAVGSATWLTDLRQSGDLGRFQADASANAIGDVTQTLRYLEPQKIEAVAEALFSANRVFVTGMRASYSLAYYLHYLGRMAIPNMVLIPGQMNSAIDDLNFATEEDLLFAITFEPHSMETINACHFACERGLKLVLLSDSPVPAPKIRADHTLIAATLSGHHFVSYIGGMAVIEALLAVVLAKGGQDARDRILSYEKLREEIKAYWPHLKKHMF